jgi:hypothetical protein
MFGVLSGSSMRWQRQSGGWLPLAWLIHVCRRHPQIKDLEATIDATPADAVIIATPMDLRKVINMNKPAAVVR